MTRRLFAVAPFLLVAACGSNPPSGASASDGHAPMVYVSSAHSPASIASCLEHRLPRARESRQGNATELNVGNGSYFVTLTPSSYGSVIRVIQNASHGGNPPESEMRFHIARCAT